MAYSVVPTVSTGDSWTAANHNTYVKDNFAASAPDLFTTKGDLAVAAGADTANRFAVGSNQDLFFAASGETLGVKWDGVYNFMNISRYTSSDWDGATAYDTVVYIDVSDAGAGGFAVPSAAKFVFGLLECEFNSGASTDYVMFSSTDYATSPMIRCEWRNDTEPLGATGWILLPANNTITFDPAGSNVNVKLEFWGYML